MPKTKDPLYKQWLSKAEEDFQFAKINLEEEKKFFDHICFHFQQSAEKFLKAYIIAKNLKFRKIHELPTLLEICQKYNPDLRILESECSYLTEFYVETRYPTLWTGRVTLNQAKKAFEDITKIRKLIRNKL